ncbi:MAG: acetyltransferase [Pseudomonadales bacterium]
MNVLRGASAFTLICVSTLVLCIPLYLMGIVLALSRGRARQAVNRRMDSIIDLWVGVNRGIFRIFELTRIAAQWQGDDDVSRDRWYVVISNHRSWSDILILQNTLWGRIPPLKFFTKQQLIWIPLLGVAMWLLGFPYVRRASREQIARQPELLALDRAATLEACRRFRDHPNTVLNFLEGTRFTAAKHAGQQARFENLLNPKLGGMSYVVAELEDKLHKIIDVTIVYPHGTPSFWDLMQGRCPEVEVLIQCRDLPEDAHQTDADAVRERLAPWIEALWHEKDARLGAALKRQAPAAPARATRTN